MINKLIRSKGKYKLNTERKLLGPKLRVQHIFRDTVEERCIKALDIAAIHTSRRWKDTQARGTQKCYPSFNDLFFPKCSSEVEGDVRVQLGLAIVSIHRLKRSEPPFITDAGRSTTETLTGRRLTIAAQSSRVRVNHAGRLHQTIEFFARYEPEIDRFFAQCRAVGEGGLGDFRRLVVADA